MLIDEIKLLDLGSKSIVNIQVHEEWEPTCVKWHPRKDGLAAIGYKNGSVTFIDVSTKQNTTIALTVTEDDDLE